ncbi:hypothetical protein [Sabulicella glaciei]|uniref:DUF1127 domain-containing protein n=1 Tax=Sabulicella glaciei TaxID=2984948 RepID=A0ABT3NZE2_9PROT|nr:hypothetical protein [Roseococcus sp. MDT2-1-1]MCW8087535.1 hypothetical protein [Roseococcus sp. MDT2-1-1]
MSASAPIYAFEIPLAKPASRLEGRSKGFLDRFAAWLQSFKAPSERNELAYVNDRMLADMGYRQDARPYASDLLMQNDVVRGLLHL